jgi:protein-disulfide isomerase
LLLLSLAAIATGILAVGALVAASGGLSGSGLPPVAAANAPPPPQSLRGERSLGDPEAPVHIEVYEDPQCSACALYFDTIEPLLVSGPVRDGRVHLTYRDFIIFGPESVDAAVGMRAADALAGRFWEFHDLVFANHAGEDVGAYSRARLAEMAVLAGLDRAAFLALLDDRGLIGAVAEESAEGRRRGVVSTPTFVIDGVLYPGVPSWQQLESRIDQAAAVAG